MVSFSSISEFFRFKLNLLDRGEDALQSSHLQCFEYVPKDNKIIGKVHASQKKKIYDVEVSFFSLILALDVALNQQVWSTNKINGYFYLHC